ncbi:histidine--tRNA ligase [Pacificimonas flava]|uniref:Histidine--tRNA ligase n=2 Tax=Pacificimonas TaxID=1960290 RepID=A0A219B8S1_9SPHN|nr:MULTISPECIES: histidine--tRNA ligase [Pacificimonas]MBZ6379527.1 histidine--tRNA ligase [Pacificimonas aurantium]OWV34681.1 histidine--tRNA ligase [Pacificimonas flava]
MSKKPAAIRGTNDFVKDEAARFDHVVDTFRRVARQFNFRPVHIPVFEQTSVFARSLGETTDVVSKEMYTFEDRSGDSVTLRPEFTAGIARAYISNGWQQHGLMKLSAWGPCFRYERPQKGRFRQFHQLDAEMLGAGEPMHDVELLAFGQQLLEDLGVAGNVSLQLNTLGDPDSRAAWQAALLAYFRRHEDALSADSRERLERNPLRILDSKDEGDRRVVAEAPIIDEFLTDDAKGWFDRVQGGLSVARIDFERNMRLVRGLDYYRHTAFEFVTDALGAQGTVLAGGRYDGLVEAMGGAPTPAIGWAAGIERLAMLVDGVNEDPIDVALVPMNEAAEHVGLSLLNALRSGGGVSGETFARGNMKKRMQRADASGAALALVIGESELQKKAVQVKDMSEGDQTSVAFGDLGFIGGYLAERRLRVMEGEGESMPAFSAWFAANKVRSK